MNKGSWFLTWRGPSKVNAFDEGNKIVKKKIVNKSFFFTMKHKLAKHGPDVKLKDIEMNFSAYRINKEMNIT
jgi:hypothetical protein